MSRLEPALYWYERAVGKMAKRYFEILKTGKQKAYAKVLGERQELSDAIDLSAREFIDGKKTLREFKLAIRDWFMYVKEAWDEIDNQS